jgi:6-phosphogluconolactonase
MTTPAFSLLPSAFSLDGRGFISLLDMRTEIRQFADVQALYAAAAEVFDAVAVEAVRDRAVCRVALAGGSTPKRLYALLAGDRWRGKLPWDAIEVFWGDERHVPPDHPDSNYQMAAGAMLSRVPIPAARVHRVRAEDADPQAVAAAYEADIRAAFDMPDGVPRFDLILLGLGADGHTASLFPGTAALAERERLVVANWVSTMSAHRITLTLPVLNAARTVVFLVAGDDKATAVQAVLQGGSGALLPAALVQPVSGRIVWLLDAAAARLLQGAP